jgi:hypothetical protein
VTAAGEGDRPALRLAPLSNVPENWVERLRSRLPEGTWRRWVYDRLAMPVHEPTEFAIDEPTLAARLMPAAGDEDKRATRAADILKEAQAIYQRAEDRSAGATTRATTLQGAVAIAASLLLAGATLVVGQSALQGAGWLAAFAVLLVGTTVGLVMAGLRALSATSTVHVWHRPPAGDIVGRARLTAAEDHVRLAAETLIAYGYNTEIAAWKVAYMAAAAWWFRIALAWLVTLALFIGLYAVAGAPTVTSTTTTTTTITATRR